MENNDQNNFKTVSKENPIGNSPVKSESANPQGEGLDQKREELLYSGKINDEVSDYLRQSDKKSYPLTAENSVNTPEIKTTSKQSIIRTFKSDIEEIIKQERMSSISISVAEQKKRQENQPIATTADTETSRKRLLLIVSVFFVFAGIGAFNFNYIKGKINPPTKKTNEISALITTDSVSEINLTKNKISGKNLTNLLSELIRGADIRLNSIQDVNVTEDENIVDKEGETKKEVDAKKFLSLINSRMPNSLFRSLMSEYMLGIHSWNGNQPFIILKTDSYENAFAGMLSWEKNMAGDLGALFSRNIPSSIEDATTTTEQILVYKKEFEDILVKNKDARALKDENGNIFLIYSLPDKETIIITSNTGTLVELFDRVIRSRTIR